MFAEDKDLLAIEDKELARKIGILLLSLREEAELTQEQLAEKVGLQPNSIYRYEIGERKMNLPTAIRVAKVLKVSITRLVPEEYLVKESNDLDPENVLEVFYQLDVEDQKMLMKQMLALLAMKKTA